jgi:predicted TIM-barrel fold metal-dependent hydrolase
MGQTGKDKKKAVNLKISPELYEELEQYSRHLNLRVTDAVLLAIANMVSQAKALGADWPVTRSWMDDEFATWIEARDEFLRKADGEDGGDNDGENE